MTIRVFTPATTHEFADVKAIEMEGEHGRFTLLPNHVDCTAALATGIATGRTNSGEELYMGVDAGTLVKIGDEVLVSTPRFVSAEQLGTLEERLRDAHERSHERDRQAQHAIARLETELARTVLETGERL